MSSWYDVRRAVSGDADQLSHFPCQNVNEKWTRDVERAIRRGLALAVAAGEKPPEVFVADVEGRLIGVVCFTRGEQVTEIELLAVVHEFRRRGVGTRLKRAVMAEAAALGSNAVTSIVHRRNEPMLRLNAKLGIVDERYPEDGDYRFSALPIELDEAAIFPSDE